MKVTHLNLAWFLFSTAFGAHATQGNIYANITGILEPVTTMNFAEAHFLVLGDPQIPAPLPYNFEEKEIFYGDYYDKHRFGTVGDYIVFGLWQNGLKSLHVQLDDKYKMMNINSYLCRWPSTKFRGYFTIRDQSSEFVSCSPMDLYFVPIGKAARGKTVKSRHGRETDGVPVEAEEEGKTESESDLNKREESGNHTDSSADHLYPHASIGKSRKAPAREAQLQAQIDGMEVDHTVD